MQSNQTGLNQAFQLFSFSNVGQHSFVSVVTAGNKEVLVGTDAVVISCQVTGLTVPLGTVKWTDSNGNDIKTFATYGSSYVIDDGTLLGDNSQTTTLTVLSPETSSDATYICLITPGFPDDAAELSKSVALNTYSKCDSLEFQ